MLFAAKILFCIVICVPFAALAYVLFRSIRQNIGPDDSPREKKE